MTGRNSSVKGSLETFIETQTKMISIHARSMLVQNFPPLPQFTGEEIDREEKLFERYGMRDLKECSPSGVE